MDSRSTFIFTKYQYLIFLLQKCLIFVILVLKTLSYALQFVDCLLNSIVLCGLNF